MATANLASPTQSPPCPGAERTTKERLVHSLALWTFLAVAAGVAWRTVRYLLQFPIWGDESFVCVNLLDKTYAGMVGPLRAGQLSPITFLWSELAMLHTFGPSELVLRLLPFVAGLASLALFSALCRRLLTSLPASLALALLAVSYYPVRHAVEVKPYAEDLFIALCLLVPAVCFLHNPTRVRWLVFLTLFVPLAVFSSYPAVLVAGGLSPALLTVVWRRPGLRARGWFVLYNLLLVTAFVGNYLLIGKPQLSPHIASADNVLDNTFQDGFPGAGAAGFLRWLVSAHTGNMFAYPIGGPRHASSLTTLLCLVGALAWWRSGNRQTLALLAGPFVMSMIAAILHKYPYGNSARLDQHLAPAICLFMGNGIATVIRCCATTPPGERRGTILVVALLAVFAVAGMIRDIVKPYKTTAELWNRTFVHDLMSRLGPRDRLAIFHAPSAVRPGLEWYFRPYQERIAWHGTVDWERLSNAGGKLWCLQIFVTKPAPDPIAVAARGRAPVQFFQSLAPAEHCAYPEHAEVYCFEP